ncbi:MAG TPA: hypothetical protein DEO59_15375, partial [Balneola sp.]|nr:hypothetical protein [Balneola sp.]
MVKRNIIEVGTEAIELSLKQAIDESVLKEIPVVGWLAKLYDSVSSVRERLEVEKLTKFLKAVNDVSEKDKYRFREKVLSNKESGQKLTKKIILVLENQSDIEKSEIVANFFIAYLDSRINESFFRRALDIISSSFLDDIQSFLEERANRSVM